jgi:cellulose synthase/poly-beta-1,6-N-acetylglucosamine synthase-like glycosyltransferase
MSLFKRIGTDRHKYKMEFYIRKITFSKSLKGSVYITIKRGKNTAMKVITR